MERVTFGRWTVLVDREATKKAYEGATGSARADCCDFCRAWLAKRHRVFPPPVMELFDKLGIDYRCEYEVYAGGRHRWSRVLFSGWFDFVGEIESGGDDVVSTDSGQLVQKLEPVPGFPDISLGLTTTNAGWSEAFEGLPRVQLEFNVWVPMGWFS